MLPLTCLLGVFYLYIQVSFGLSVPTQTPESISVFPGETVVIHCRPSSAITDSDGRSNLQRNQKKADQPPELLIYHAIKRQSGVPERFSGGKSGSPSNDFILTTNGALAEDEPDYYCPQGD